VKPIETVYKGYRFRSRLEARWAVFFDAIRVSSWQYESQGFDLGHSGAYLPDFSVQGLLEPAWFEVKPVKPTEQEIDRCAALAYQSGRRVFMLCGQPYHGEHETIYIHPWNGPLGYRTVELVVWPSYGVVGMVDPEDRTGRPQFHLAYGQPSDLHRAFDAARGARFEHGESPKV
jgi:hypothetical protein